MEAAVAYPEGVGLPGQSPHEVIRSLDWAFTPRFFAVDLLRMVPGLTADDNTGGRANLVTLRGYNAGFGHDLAAYYDGIPLNLPSTVAGHGYMDVEALIPETVGRVDFVKGPFEPRYGNMAAAGAINFVPDRRSMATFMKGFGGLYSTYGGTAEATAMADKNRLRIAVAGRSTEGYSKPTEGNLLLSRILNTLDCARKDELAINGLSDVCVDRLSCVSINDPNGCGMHPSFRHGGPEQA
jgi:hypothetical protein